MEKSVEKTCDAKKTGIDPSLALMLQSSERREKESNKEELKKSV
jgi:hypothetical protein